MAGDPTQPPRLDHARLPKGHGGLPFHYILFEVADGDLRKVIRAKEKMDVAWILRCMHGICVGIGQLHSIDIAHQDLKPSNVLMSDDDVKIADLGRASCRNVGAAHDAYPIAGDKMYSPPECLYGFTPEEWAVRRLSCDLYHIGSMMTYMINGANMTMLMLSGIANEFRPDLFKGLYQDVSVHLRSALEDKLLVLGSWLSGPDGQEVVQMIRTFCDPHPEIRLKGVRGGRSGPSLQWHISKLDLLSKKAAAGLLEITPRDR